MKRALTICGLFCALMFGVVAVSAQKGANFAGEWELDKAKSALAGPVAESIKSATWVVTQDDKQLTREQKIERIEGGGPGGGRGRGLGLGGPLTVKLDGSETTTESERGKTVSKAKWLNEGKTLEISASSTFSGQNGELTVTTTEHWELADEGKTLKVHRKTEGLRNPSESTWVLTKK
jgi:polyisoprenoid-binding protein YceI